MGASATILAGIYNNIIAKNIPILTWGSFKMLDYISQTLY